MDWQAALVLTSVHLTLKFCMYQERIGLLFQKIVDSSRTKTGHTDTHTALTALLGPLKWSVKHQREHYFFAEAAKGRELRLRSAWLEPGKDGHGHVGEAGCLCQIEEFGAC